MSELLPLLIILLVIIGTESRKKYIGAVIKRKKGDKEMEELAKRFLGKDVIINALPSTTIDGILKEVVDNSIIVEKDGKDNIVNLDYVVRLREYPTNKRGKKRSIIIEG